MNEGGGLVGVESGKGWTMGGSKRWVGWKVNGGGRWVEVEGRWG